MACAGSLALGVGMKRAQWVVDGYTLMFAALLSAGAVADRAWALRPGGQPGRATDSAAGPTRPVLSTPHG